jgi:Mor family transcriptional regulator
MLPISDKRNGRGRRDGRGEKEREEAKKRKMSERMVNRITRDPHNEKIHQSYSRNGYEKT